MSPAASISHGAPVSLSELTTMGVGGRPREFIEATSEQEIIDAVADVDARGVPLLVLGGGSNLVVADEGFEGTVVRVRSRGMSVESQDDGGGVFVRVAAGEPWDGVVHHAVEQSWSGIEALSGIPGSTGATPVQNVGAYGQDVAQTIWQVRVYDRELGTVRTLANVDCAFAYRHSLMKASTDGSPDPSPRYVVLNVCFYLRRSDLCQPIGYADLAQSLGIQLGGQVPLAQAREAVLDQRSRRGMVLDARDYDTWSCGSFFTNPILTADAAIALRKRVAAALHPHGASAPEFSAQGGTVKTSAAWLIDQAGFGKGFGLPGPAALSTKHTLAVTNRGNASARDILTLARRVQSGVHATFGLTLLNEPVLVGTSL